MVMKHEEVLWIGLLDWLVMDWLVMDWLPISFHFRREYM